MADQEEDYSVMLEWMAVMNARGNASAYAVATVEQKQVVERSVATDWAIFMSATSSTFVTNIVSNAQPNQAPDILADINGIPSTIEVTELVDGNILDKIKKSTSTGTGYNVHHGHGFLENQWTEARFIDFLNNSIDNKEKKYAGRNVTFDVLLIHTDEMWLSPHQVEEWLSSTPILRRPHLKNCFLVMHRLPMKDLPKVFKLYGDLN